MVSAVRDSKGRFARVHGMARTAGGKKSPLYRVWTGMRERCSNPNHYLYRHYGGRSIRVCEEWESFPAFQEFAVAAGYRRGLSIDRIDNNRGYSPDNVRFVTMVEQGRNRRNTRWLTAFGETKPRGAWCEDPRCLVRYSTLCSRLHKGWPDEIALATPPQPRNKRKVRV